jgi:hypothetical protein
VCCRIRWLFLALLLALGLSGCANIIADKPAVVITPAPQPCHCEEPEPAAEPGVIGALEHVLVGSELILLKARIDTGAATTSIGIASMQKFERDGARWIKFTIEDRLNGKEHLFERPLVRMVGIKRHGTDSLSRPVVRMRITIGDMRRNVDATLADRSDFEYPVLVGRNFLAGKAVVDVSRSYVTSGE